MSVWSRLNGVAGNLRSNISQFAQEVLEVVDEVSRPYTEQIVHRILTACRCLERTDI